MPTSDYVDLSTIHDYSVGTTVTSASWFDQVRENLEALARPPRVQVRASAPGPDGAFLPEDNEYTPLTFTIKDYDTDGFSPVAYPPTHSTEITIPAGKGGGYQVNAWMSIDGGEPSDVDDQPFAKAVFAILLAINGTIVHTLEQGVAPNTGVNGLDLAGTIDAELSAGDVIELYGYRYNPVGTIQRRPVSYGLQLRRVWV